MSIDKKAIYIHIPKTGGSTLHAIISRVYKDKERFHVKNNRELPLFDQLSDSEKLDIKILEGHMAFGHHDKFLTPNEVNYFSMMRDPVKRIISNYNHIITRPRHDYHKELVDNNYTLKQYVESGVIANTENAQVRLFANAINLPHGKCTKETLETAKQNVENHFSVVGINECYDETLLLIKNYYNWATPYYVRKNVGNRGSKPADLDDETLAAIQKYNALDIELYAWVKERLAQQILAEGDSFQKQLSSFQKKNKVVQKIVPIKNKLFHNS